MTVFYEVPPLLHMKMRKIKILHIISSLRRGGGQLLLSSLVANHDPEQFEYHVISLVEGGEVATDIRNYGVSVIELDFSSVMGSMISMYKLLTIIKGCRPDLVHTWMYHADLIGGVASLLVAKRKIIWGIHHADPKTTKIPTMIIAKICGLISGVVPSKIIACSALSADSHVKYGYSESRINVIENGINLSSFRPARNDRVVDAYENVVIGHVARWHLIKGHEIFIKAAGIVYQKFPESRFVMVGSGVDWDNAVLVNWLKQAGITDVVELYSDRTDIPVVMNLFDIYVSSSRSESFSLTLVEAMACGVPCVATRTGVAEEIVGESLRVVEVDDVDHMARSIEDLVKLPALKRREIGRDGIKLIKERFDEKEMIFKYEQLYQQVAS